MAQESAELRQLKKQTRLLAERKATQWAAAAFTLGLFLAVALGALWSVLVTNEGILAFMLMDCALMPFILAIFAYYYALDRITA